METIEHEGILSSQNKNLRNYEENFGKVQVSQIYTKSITCEHITVKNITTFTIKRYPDLCHLHKMFEISPSEGRINSTEKPKLVVTYRPTIPNYRSLEIYEYIDSNSNSFHITLKGEAIAPSCNISCKNVFFLKSVKYQNPERIIEISNNSSVDALFKFGSASSDVFQISPAEGTIIKYSHQNFIIKFNPYKKGIFFSPLFCLIWNAKPLLIEVTGYYGDELNQNQLEALSRFNFPTDLSFGFGAYLNDSLVKRIDTPPFSLSSTFLDFGRVENGFATTTTSLTNHLNDGIFIEWYQGQDIFEITPRQVKVSGNNSVQFECHFRPDQSNRLFAETLMAQVHWKDVNQPNNLSRPLTCILKVQGHSFPENEGWIAPVDLVPENIVLPPCLPGFATAATLKLVNRTHLPVMYKLEPPFKTNVIAKPMMGKFRTFEIIVIQLQTDSDLKKTYVEEWKIIFNGQEEKVFYIAGEAKVPSVEIGCKNKIQIGTVQEGCQFNFRVPIQNKCDFSLTYKFQFDEDSNLKIKPHEGMLHGNDTIDVNLYVKGSHCQQETEKISCLTYVIDTNGAVVGAPHITEAELQSYCSYSELCAFPNYLDVGVVQHGAKIFTEFEAFNFGDSTVFFHSHYNIENEYTRVKYFDFKPRFGEVPPKSSVTFIISGTARYDGPQVVLFGYYNRVSKYSSMLYGDKIILFQINYTCDYPCIQIEEVVEHNFGPIFGKSHFYHNYLNVPRINEVLRNLNKCSMEQIDLRLPECEIQRKKFYVVLGISNTGLFESKISLRRKKMCDCPFIEMSDTSFDKRKKGYNCPHREIVTLELSNTNICVNDISYLTIHVKYTIPENNTICYILGLSDERKIELHFNVFAISYQNPKLSFYSKHLRATMENINIGTRVAPAQLVWIYNNTRKLLQFDFDTEDIERLCRIEGFKVLELLNPKDQIDPFSTKALLIKFHPIEVKNYDVKIGASYNEANNTNVKFQYQIRGDGIYKTDRSIKEKNHSETNTSKFFKSIPIDISIEHIAVKNVPTWNRQTELIFIKNISNDIIQYVWSSVVINDVIEVSTENKYGILEPKEIQPVVIVIKSFSKPCVGSILLPCELINYTGLVLHEFTKEKHATMEKEIKQEFAITDSAIIQHRKNPVKIHPKPEPTTITICLDISTIHTKDFDRIIEPEKQLRQRPNQTMQNVPKSLFRKYYPNISTGIFPEINYQPEISPDNRLLYYNILDELITDVLFSKIFRIHLETVSQAPSHYYTEFVMSDQDVMSSKIIETPLSEEDIASFRKSETEKFLNQPKLTELSGILQNVIYDSLMVLTKCPQKKINIKEIDEKIKKQIFHCKSKDCTCTHNIQ